MESVVVGLLLGIFENEEDLVLDGGQFLTAEVDEDVLQVGLPFGMGGVEDVLGLKVDCQDELDHGCVAGDVDEKLGKQFQIVGSGGSDYFLHLPLVEK